MRDRRAPRSRRPASTPAARRATTSGCSPARAASTSAVPTTCSSSSGSADAADRAVGGFSLGMRQRLQLAAALLGDPGVLVLDEPANGLDPEGIAWLRAFLRHLAGPGPHGPGVEPRALRGRADRRRRRDHRPRPVRPRVPARRAHRPDAAHVVVRTPQAAELTAALATPRPHAKVTVDDGWQPARRGRRGADDRSHRLDARAELHELRPAASDLEAGLPLADQADGATS